MSVANFLAGLEPERKAVLAPIHDIILDKDKTVEASLGKMMGTEMIIYKANGMFKYGLASVKNYMSLHLMPIYCSPELYEKYARLLTKANFQKGCINFKNREAMPLPIVKELIADAAKVDLSAIRQAYLKSKTAAK